MADRVGLKIRAEGADFSSLALGLRWRYARSNQGFGHRTPDSTTPKGSLAGTFGRSGGQGGIRTHDTVAGISVFETDAFSHSATCPQRLRGLEGPGN